MVLPALARFAGQDQDAHLTTKQAPVQKFWWKDLFARRGGTYKYRIVPMGGTPGQTLSPLAGVEPLVSNSITLTEKRPPFSAYFNRGIIATQALSKELNDKPSIDALTPHITDPADPIRIRLMGQLFEGVTSLLDRADPRTAPLTPRSTNSTTRRVGEAPAGGGPRRSEKPHRDPRQ